MLYDNFQRDALLLACELNAGKLKSVLPHYYQHVTCATRGDKTLDHLYSARRNRYKALPLANLTKSLVFLIPAYKQKLPTGSTSDMLNTEVVWC
jgi:hypothetical protein